MGVVGAFALIASCVGAALAGNSVTITVDGRAIQPDVPPQIVGDRVMVPVRAVAEALGANVDWEASTRTVRISSGGRGGPGAAPIRTELLEAAIAPQSAVECAIRWAEATMNRNGALRYAVSAPELRAKGMPESWVTGVSSPSVDSYEVSFSPADLTPESGRLRVRLFWWTSTGSSGASVEDIEVKHFPEMQGSPWLVVEVTEERNVDSGGAGCQAGEGDRAQGDQVQGAQAQGARAVSNRIPFLAIERPVKWNELGRYPVRRASWDLDSGVLSLGEKRFEFTDEQKRGFARFAWDGGERIALTPEPGDDLDLAEKDESGATTTGAAVELVRLNSLFDMVSVPGAGDETLIVRRPGFDEPFELEIRTVAGAKRLSLTPGLGAGVSLLRPIGLEQAGEDVKMYFESTVDRSNGTSGCGLVEATYSGDRIDWRVIANDLDIHEAGAGTKMVKAGDTVYIGRQEGTVLKVDVATGESSPCTVIDEAIRLFRDRYAHRVEYAAPPVLYEYGDVLIVDYEAPALREEVLDGRLNDRIAPVKCILAIRDGQVAGQIIIAGGKTMVLNGDMVTQTVVRPGEDFPRWVFPVN